LGKQLFTPAEWILFGVAVAGCVIGVHGLATGYITI
jgi:arginine:ornithine antiporter/lysine permease